MSDLQSVIERFVASCRSPVLSEPGEELIELRGDNLCLEQRQNFVQLQAWDQRRNLVRRVTAVESQSRSTLQLRTERFGKKHGTLSLIDRFRPAARNLDRKSFRLEFRELFRRFLRREFSGYEIAEISTESDLEHTLSPAYPRALLRTGRSALAAIGATAGAPVDGALTFGLIWLDYLRQRNPALTVQGLVLFLPEGEENNTCLRLRFLDSSVARYAVFSHTEDGITREIDLHDHGNIDSHLERCHTCDLPDSATHAALHTIPGVDSVSNQDGSLTYRVHGLPFARFLQGHLELGLETKTGRSASNVREIQAFASQLLRFRSPHASGRHHPLYLRHPEAWLDSQVRLHLRELDATLLPEPIYGQVPALAACDRGVLDLLAVDGSRRLAVLELKAEEDVHLPLQALDYWIRVQWHLGRGEFANCGYFPEIELAHSVPRLLLVAPAMQFHPSNERVLRFFAPGVPVERLGVGLEWRKEFKLIYRT